jgi:hypothetical protein
MGKSSAYNHLHAQMVYHSEISATEWADKKDRRIADFLLTVYDWSQRDIRKSQKDEVIVLLCALPEHEWVGIIEEAVFTKAGLDWLAGIDTLRAFQ